MIKKKPKPLSVDNVLSNNEIKLLKSACETYEERLLIFGLLYTGMRISEFIHFNKSWINRRIGSIIIPTEQKCPCYECKKEIWRKRKDKNTGETIERILKKPSGIWMPKTKHGHRRIEILPEIKDIFEEYFKDHYSISEVIKHRIMGWSILKEVSKRADIPHKVFPHAIRATFASILAEKGFDVWTIQSTLGWASLEPAMSYIRLFGSKIKEEFKKKW